ADIAKIDAADIDGFEQRRTKLEIHPFDLDTVSLDSILQRAALTHRRKEPALLRADPDFLRRALRVGTLRQQGCNGSGRQLQEFPTFHVHLRCHASRPRSCGIEDDAPAKSCRASHKNKHARALAGGSRVAFVFVDRQRAANFFHYANVKSLSVQVKRPPRAGCGLLCPRPLWERACTPGRYRSNRVRSWLRE